MYESHDWVKTPTNPDIPIWRYFKYERFVDLIQSGRLHFARFDQFADPWEGVLPPDTVALAKDRFTNAPRTPGDELTDFQMLVRDVNRVNKLGSYANCWFMNEHESDGMWRLYSPEGVAVRSTFRRLCTSLANEPEPVHVGEIRYVDFRMEQPPTYGNTLAVAYYKRKEFEHERELRAVVVKPPADWTSGSPPYAERRDSHPKYMKVASDLDTLIDRVYISPGRPASFAEQVRGLLRQRRLDKPIAPSSLDDLPVLL